MKKSLAKSNPFMRDPTTREHLVYQSVASSSAIEGIRAPFKRKALIIGKSEARKVTTKPAEN